MTQKDIDWLGTNEGYCQGLAATTLGELRLDGWQVRAMRDGSKIHAYLKARQVGFSFAVAADALAECQLTKGHLEILTSVNLKDAHEKITYAKELYESIPRGFKSKLTTDNKTELGWANGSRILTMFRPRGRGPGNVRVDEFAYMQDPREVYRGAVGVTVRGGKVVIGSTLKGNAGMAYEILTGDTDVPQFKNIARTRVYWWQSSALCENVAAATKPVDIDGRVAMAAELLSTEERVDKWATESLKLLSSMLLLEDFQQEFELMPLEAEAAFISWELINRCADYNLTVYETCEALEEAVQGELYAGVDIGRRRDTTELFVFELYNGKYRQRMLKTFRRMAFEDQKAELASALEILPIRRMAIDETGIGMNLAEDLNRMYPDVVEPVNFASKVDAEIVIGNKKVRVPVKERMATDVKISMERGDIVIYRDPELMRQIFAIKRMVTSASNVRYDADRNNKHHADKFWAMGLALFASRTQGTSAMGILPAFARLGGDRSSSGSAATSGVRSAA